MCGGTPTFSGGFILDRGLSPRVRGNPTFEHFKSQINRSIPACAGEPGGRRGSDLASGVYPRVCGGTPGDGPGLSCAGGLSPRVRGNHTIRPTAFQHPRSIPACAGEPQSSIVSQGTGRVYPRVCGGTDHGNAAVKLNDGLSPRVRGNPGIADPERVNKGSIPACAGEPDLRIPLPGRMGVYPRVCGGTQWCYWCALTRQGLSPRVRGNPAIIRPDYGGRWSIPACAGEPAGQAGPGPGGPVYPRVCGGTVVREVPLGLQKGLSPRVRGNLLTECTCMAFLGSIPACAGEPTYPTRPPSPY